MERAPPAALPPAAPLQTLDALRFIACVGIYLHHSLEYSFGGAARQFFIERTSGLALFVDLFFCISGFTIAFVYDGKINTWRDNVDFYARRLARLVPLHWLTFFVSLLFWLGVSATGASPAHSPSLSASCLASTAFLLHAYAPCSSVNGVSWSLSVEMGLYLLAPAVLAFSARYTIATTLLILCLIAVTCLTAIAQTVDHWVSQPAYFRGLPSFLVGIAIYRLRGPIGVLPIGKLVGPLLVAIVFSMTTPSPPWITLLLSYLLVTCACSCDQKGHAHPLTRKLASHAELTYGIYMWHMIFVLVILNAISDKLLALPGYMMLALTACTFMLVYFCAAASLRWFEKPIRHWCTTRVRVGLYRKT